MKVKFHEMKFSNFCSKMLKVVIGKRTRGVDFRILEVLMIFQKFVLAKTTYGDILGTILTECICLRKLKKVKLG